MVTMPAVAINFRDLAPLQRELEDASATVATSEELPAGIRGLLRSLAEELRDMDRDEWDEAIDPYLLVELEQVAISALLALDEDDDESQLEGAELALEAMREILGDIEEGSTVSDERSGREVARWLKDQTRASNKELAGVLQISERKLERWFSGSSEPGGEDEVRLRLASRLVNQLRHGMTGYGALRWLTRPFRELGGSRPRDLLGAPEEASRLLALAGQARRSDAS
jgi:DNA-binding transcriptional regulator YiaG